MDFLDGYRVRRPVVGLCRLPRRPARSGRADSSTASTLIMAIALRCVNRPDLGRRSQRSEGAGDAAPSRTADEVGGPLAHPGGAQLAPHPNTRRAYSRAPPPPRRLARPAHRLEDAAPRWQDLAEFPRPGAGRRRSRPRRRGRGTGGRDERAEEIHRPLPPTRLSSSLPPPPANNPLWAIMGAACSTRTLSPGR